MSRNAMEIFGMNRKFLVMLSEVEASLLEEYEEVKRS
ncbi:MAG: hypothetical protein PWR03_2086 [Tenuifilum sp.]|nr:hypothetical protein [Tenuifilum sp.]